MPTTIRVSDRITARMLHLGLSNEAVAAGVRRSVQTIRNWRENGENIGATDLRRLIDVLQCSVDYLLGLTDEV